MRLFNTLSQSTQELLPLEKGKVRIYVCGVTPYDTTHLGHAFLYLSFDSLIRYLEYQGYKVHYVQNVTDIDDDMIKKAKERGTTWDELGRQETAKFLKDLKALNIRMPDDYVKATDEIPRIIKRVEKLIESKHAYEKEGTVFFDIGTDNSFGELAKAIGVDTHAAMLKMAEQPYDERKKDQLDFILWQKHVEGEPGWESPWGLGRPGWHIECSSMALNYLGDQIDIHGGGGDLVFPHHTCEIAQAESLTGKRPFSQFWLHTATLYKDGFKMSKSKGNLIRVSELLKEYSANEIRIMLQYHHYRQSWELLDADSNYAVTLVKLLEEIKILANGKKAEKALDLFDTYMANDLDCYHALELIKESAKKAIKNNDKKLASIILKSANILGIDL